jgi:hypothetical protein
MPTFLDPMEFQSWRKIITKRGVWEKWRVAFFDVGSVL